MSGVGIIGSGAFGTALAITLARTGEDVALWCRDPAQARALAHDRRNTARLPGARFPDSLRITDDISSVSQDILLIAVPAQSLGDFLDEHGHRFRGRTLVSCAKGVDRRTFRRPSETIAASCPDSTVAVLTGPSFAEDIARGLPTALTLAANRGGADIQRRLSGATLRLYLTEDIVGAELGGALKNVIALAAGLTVGAGLGESARAAVITRGFAEISRFAGAHGARAETLAGLSGLGDLVLTCTSPKSRNFSAGLAIGRGQTVPSDRTIEGLATAEAVSGMAEKAGLDMPLTRMVAAVTSGRLTVAEAADQLMSRPLKKE